MPDDYYKGVGQLAPTDGIKDPQVRAFCDSLANVWQLRNGNTGSNDKQRFITKEEWDFIAKNPNIRALAGIGQPGASTLEPGPGDGAGPTPDLPDWIQNLVDFLAAGITLVDFTNVYKISNELFANYFAISTEFRNEITNINNMISDLEDGITQINTIDPSSTSPSAQAVYALKVSVEDPITGLEAAHAAIVEINDVSATSDSANARTTAALIAQVNDPATGNVAAMAAIAEINNVSATSTSANARRTAGLEATVYDPNTGVAKSHADIVEINNVSVTSGSANARTVAGMSAQVGTNLALINEINDVRADSGSASARKLSGVMAYSGLKARVFAQPNAPVSDATYTLVPGDLWIDTAHDNQMFIRNVDNTAWVDASDKRIAGSSAGFAQEVTARTTSDSALAQQLNYLWSQVGNTNALVYGQNIVQVNPNSGTATKFEQVYVSMPKDASGNPIKAASQVFVDNYINANENRAKSQYSLIVEAQAGGVKAATGMILSAEVNQGQPQSAVVFRADKFAIYHPNNSPSYIFPPFLVSNGVVRMNLAWINDRIQSDNFVSSFNAQGAYIGPGTGWVIRQNGSAEFHGTVLSARIYSGSVIVDRNSNQELYALAIGTWVGFDPLNAATQVWSVNTRMYGPAQHASVLKQQRVRTGDLVFTVTFMGVADHAVSIWWRKNGGGWNYLNTTTTPSDDVGAVTVGLNQAISVSNNDFIDFGVSATYGNLVVANPAKPNIQNWNLSVTATNL